MLLLFLLVRFCVRDVFGIFLMPSKCFLSSAHKYSNNANHLELILCVGSDCLFVNRIEYKIFQPI